MVKKKFNAFPRGERGWIRIVEAFVGILLITGIVLVVLDKGYIKKEDPSVKIYDVENSILGKINLNDSLRNDIIGVTNLPTNSTNLPQNIRGIIESEQPSYLVCIARICDINDDCLSGESNDKDIYAKSSIVTTNSTVYNPRQIKLFCWIKE